MVEQSKASATAQPTGEPAPAGIGGWLLLMAFAQAAGPVKFVASLIAYYGSMESRIVQNIPVTVAGEALLNMLAGALWFYAAILFFRQSKRFPRFFTYEVIAIVVLIPVNALWVALGIYLETGRSVGPSLLSAIEPLELAKAVGAAVLGGIWIIYLKRSRRAANTFVR
jgi:NAD/NADP transhydrogenase beta subunit